MGLLAAKREYEVMADRYNLDRLFRMWLLQLCLPVSYSPGATISHRQGVSIREKASSMSIELRTAPHQHSGRDVPSHHAQRGVCRCCRSAHFPYGNMACRLWPCCSPSPRPACSLNASSIAHPLKPSTLNDWSATITGILLALTLPPSFPLWMGIVAGFVAIAIGKALFGGLGYNAVQSGAGRSRFRAGGLPGRHHHLGACLCRTPLQRIHPHVR